MSAIVYEEIKTKEEFDRLKEYIRKNMMGAGHTQVDPDTYEPYIVIEEKNYKLATARNPKTGLKWD
jgi:hypothetical protein